jgi:flagellar biosynthesis protein FlhB
MSLAAGPSAIAGWGEAVACAVTETGVYAGGLLVVIGLADYGWSWWRLERSLWMTTEEMREEMRSDSARHRPRRTQ